MTAPVPEISLNPALDAEALAARFAAKGRIHVPGILTPAAAQSLYDCLHRTLPWQTAFRYRERHIDLSREQVALLDHTRHGLLSDAVWGQARDGFAYCYNNYPIADTYPKPDRPDWPVYRLFEMLNGEPFLEFARRLTGLEGIRRADAQATLYHAGHFLTEHDDDVRSEHRLAAFVLNLTPQWRVDWGGLLMFHGGDGHVEEAFTPGFNALNIFRVPMRHSVSFVPPYCPAARYSITGWLRSQ